MTVEEIFKKVASHQIKGLMFHQELANYYDFMGLKGYKRCHEYHYFAESWGFRKLNRYYINHYNKLIPHAEIDRPRVISESWHRATRFDINTNTKQNAIKNAINSWVEWEKETKALYESTYKELINLDEVATAMFIKDFIKDVDEELKTAERCLIDRMAIDFDLSVIVPEQCYIHDKYKKMMKDIFS